MSPSQMTYSRLPPASTSRIGRARVLQAAEGVPPLNLRAERQFRAVEDEGTRAVTGATRDALLHALTTPV